MKSRKRSFTLLEVLIVVVIILIAVFAVWESFVAYLHLTFKAREIGIATDDTKDVLEKIKSEPFVNLNASFPNTGDDGCCIGYNCADLCPADSSGDISGDLKLREERITVTYPQGIGNYLANITVITEWLSKDGKNSNITFNAMRTRY